MSLLLLFNQPAAASVTFDASSSSAGNGTNTVTWSHTVAAGSNRYLSVLVDSYFAAGEVTGVTFNGVALSNVGSYSANDPRASIWGLVAPDTGTHNVTVTFAGAASSNGACYAMSFTGVDQTTPTGTFASANNTSTTPSVTSPSTDANGMIVSVVADYNGQTITISSGTTRASVYGWTQCATQAGGTAATSWSCANDLWTACCVLLKPAAGGSSPQTITATGIPSSTAFGSHTVTASYALTATGIPSSTAFGAHTVTASYALTATGVPSSTAFGAHTITTSYDLVATGIPSSTAFGSHTVTTSYTLTATGIPSSTAFGNATIALTGGTQDLTATGFAGAQAWGSVYLDLGPAPLGYLGGPRTVAWYDL